MMKPKHWIECPYRWGSHMAVAASTKIMYNIMNVLERGIPSG